MTVAKPNYTYLCKVLRVVDGDTLDLEVDLGFDVRVRERVRLAGVDTPELRSSDKNEREKAKKAKARVLSLAEEAHHRGVLVSQRYQRGKYGRVIGDVYFGRYHLNSYLLSEGLANPATF